MPHRPNAGVPAHRVGDRLGRTSLGCRYGSTSEVRKTYGNSGRRPPNPAARCGWRAGCGTLKGEEEGCTLPDLALGPHPATVPMDDALHGGQSYPRTLEFAGAVQALEGSEEL